MPAYSEKSPDHRLLPAAAPSRPAGRATSTPTPTTCRRRPKWEMEALTAARGGARPPPADLARPGARGRCRSSASTAATPPSSRAGRLYAESLGDGDGPLPGPVLEVRPAHLRDVAGDPPGGRHRHARDGLEPAAGDRLLQGRTPARPSTTSRSRSTATSSGRARRWPTRSAS